MSILDLVYQYRTLVGRCEVGAGLDFDQIDLLGALEAEFRTDGREGRKYRRDDVVLRALVRGPDINDTVAVHDLGPGGMSVTGAPYASEGDVVEIVIDADELSYRFKARVQWVRDDGDDYEVGLAFVGLPVRLHHGPASEPVADESLDVIAA